MPPINLTGYRLTFDDEFNSRSISQTGVGTTWADIRSEWRFDVNSDIGFGHSSFVDPSSGYDPFSVRAGSLSITAVPDRTTSGYPGSWESGLITTQNNFSQTYGYFEIRADFSAQTGAWDAFWLLPNHQLPNPTNPGTHQELDVVEHYGGNDKGVYSTIHTTDPQGSTPWQVNRQVYSEMANSSGYHTYGMNWQPDAISFYVDGQFVGSQATPSDMHSPMYIIVDLATQSGTSENSIASHIDYIRAYSNDPSGVAVVQDIVSAPDGHDPGLYGATAITTAQGGAGQSTLLIHDATDAAVARLYYGLLDRAPDAEGLHFWGVAAHNGTPMSSIAQGFFESKEYANKHGGESNQQFVDHLYMAALGRAPDASGEQFWLSALSHGNSRADVAVGIVESPEAQLHLAPQIEQGSAAQPQLTSGVASLIIDATDAAVARLYYGLLDRAPDAEGLHFWGVAAHNGTPMSSIAQGFSESKEYANKHGGESNQQFVDHLYMAALGRAPDASGEQFWLSALSHGSSRADVAVGIVESPEAQLHLAPQIGQGWHLG